MTRRPLLTTQLVFLVATAWVLVATSRVPEPTCTGNSPEVRAFAVSGNCGPEGVVIIESSTNCTVILDGGMAVSLPDRGGFAAPGALVTAAGLGLSGQVLAPDGGSLLMLDGGRRSGITETYRQCDGSSDGGTVVLSCQTFGDTAEETETCEAVLTPVP